jgi:periplasmic protein TonB
MARASLGSLLAEDGPTPRPRAAIQPDRSALRPVPVPDLELRQIDDRPPLGLGLVSVSVLLHAGLAVAIVVVPILAAESLPEAASGVQVFFAEPLTVAPPPPPPAPAVNVKRAPSVPTPTETPALTPPLETPEQIVPEEAAGLDTGGDAEGGVEGGAASGVVGAIVGGLPQEVPPPPPVHVGHGVREPVKVKHVDPVYPEIAARAMVQGNVVVELQVSPQGRVTDAQIVKGIPLLNEAALQAVRQWVYTPTLVDGVPVRLIMTVTVRFRIT